MAVALARRPARRRLATILRLLRGVIVGLVILIAAVAVALAVLVRPNAEGIDMIFGHPIFSVASGSMTPAIDTGDLIVDNPVSVAQAADLHAGQIISFRESGASSLIVTHRVVAVLPARGAATVQYRTKGDANNAPDLGTVAPAKVLGVYQARIPFGAYVVTTLHQPLTFVILVMIPVVYLAEEEIRRRWVALGAQEAERKRAAHEQATKPD